MRYRQTLAIPIRLLSFNLRTTASWQSNYKIYNSQAQMKAEPTKKKIKKNEAKLKMYNCKTVIWWAVMWYSTEPRTRRANINPNAIKHLFRDIQIIRNTNIYEYIHYSCNNVLNV